MGSYAIVQTAAGALVRVKPDGSQQALPLPQGVTVSTYRRIRGVVFQRRLILVNGVSVSVQIDGNLIARILVPRAPNSVLTVAAGAAGAITGTYRYKVSFAVTEGDNVLGESSLSEASAEVTVAAQKVTVSNIPISVDPNVNTRRIYRTTDGPGSEYYLVTSIHDNITTSFTDDLTDEETSLLPVESSLGQPPGTTGNDRFEGIATWRDRLWAFADSNPDRLYYSGNRVQYGWANFLVAQPEGADVHGITALAPRRDELWVAKRASLWHVTGDGPASFRLLGLHQGVGCRATDSVKVIDDRVYFLADDGVYTWGPEGITCISRDLVDDWFTSDTYFNRVLFPDAFAIYNEQLNQYQLHLAAAGSTTVDRWVTYDVSAKRWYGIHRTEAFGPMCGTELGDEDDIFRPAIGASDGGIYKGNRAARRDNTTAITFRATTNPHHASMPDLEKFFGRMSLHTHGETDGTLTIERAVGGLAAIRGPLTLVSLVRVGSTVTGTTATPHEIGHEEVTIAGANQADYNGLWQVVRTGATTFTFDVGVLTPVTPATGTITAAVARRADLTADLTKTREVLPRLGVGRVAQLSFVNAEDDQNVQIRGYEVDPVNTLGRR